jgi:hypothetical protein
MILTGNIIYKAGDIDDKLWVVRAEYETTTTMVVVLPEV